jgi:hypothetical protein
MLPLPPRFCGDDGLTNGGFHYEKIKRLSGITPSG